MNQSNTDPELQTFNSNFDEAYNDSLRTLNKFLREYKSENDKFNLISVKAGKWLIPNDKITQMYLLLENCRTNNVRSHFAEPQSKGDEVSCLFIDFDIYKDRNDWVMDEEKYKAILELINDILSEYFIIKNTLEYHCLITTRKTVDFDPSKEQYRYGFHMLFSIKMTSLARRFLIGKLMQNEKYMLNSLNNDTSSDDDIQLDDLLGHNGVNDINDDIDDINSDINDINSNVDANLNDVVDPSEDNIKEFIEETEEDLGIKFKDAVDMASAWVPVLIRGNCRVDKVPHDMKVIFKVIKKRRTVFKTIQISNFGRNICHEFSVNHQTTKGIKKYPLFLRDDIKRLIAPKSSIADDNQLEYMDNNQKVNLVCVNDICARDLKELLDIIDITKITGFQWMQVLKAIMKIHKSYKPLAEYFSRKSSYWNKKGFNEKWEYLLTADNNTTIGTIKYLAKTTNPKEYEKYFSYSIYNLAKNKVFKHQGKLNDYDSASILEKILSQVYKTSVDMTIPYDKRKKILCQFITPDSDKREGEVWKWRIGAQTAPISKYIYQKLENVFEDIILYLKKSLTSKDDADYKKNITQIIRNLKTSCTKFGNETNANNIIKVLSNLLYKEAFIEEMDKDKYIIGVGNGVLELGELRKPKINLINRYHEYKISMYTPVKYKMFPDNDPKIKILMKGLRGIIMEEDSFTFIMCMLGSCLNGDYKDLCYLFLAGQGQNGKSTLLELFTNTLGSMYAKKYRNTVLTNKASGSDTASSGIMPLINARAAYCSESNEGDRVNIAVMKELLSHEKISGRGLFKDEINFKLHCHHIMTLNHPLTINTTDHGTWRRIAYYKCKRTFCKNPKTKYEMKVNTAFAQEYPEDPEYLSAFLQILIKYYIIFEQKYGASLDNIPNETIRRETNEYRNAQDTINKFIMKKIVLTGDDENIITVDSLSIKYTEWYGKYYGEKAPSIMSLNNKFYNSALCKRFVTVPGNDERVLRGMRILDDANDKLDHEKFFYSPTIKPGRKSKASKKVSKETQNNINDLVALTINN